jgi:predicted dithiol-disulfide oxidoreductase (DUF899 family)
VNESVVSLSDRPVVGVTISRGKAVQVWLRAKLPAGAKVDTPYVFEGPYGKKTLSGLFAGRSQLIVHHFMFSPEWEEGGVGCSFHSDHDDGVLVYLENHDVDE